MPKLHKHCTQIFIVDTPKEIHRELAYAWNAVKPESEALGQTSAVYDVVFVGQELAYARPLWIYWFPDIHAIMCS